MPSDSLSAGLIVCRFGHFAALALLFGALAYPLYALPAADRGPSPGTGGLLAAWALALATGLGWFAFTAAGMAGSLSAAWDPSTLAEVLGQTDFGHLWLARMGALLAAGVLLFLPVRGAAVFAAAAALGSLAWTGHANATEGVRGLAHRFADVAHLITAGLWLGALPPLAARLARAHPQDAPAIFEVVSRFSRVALPAVALLVLTGALNAALIMERPIDLLVTAYGRLLGVKLMLVAVMIALAGVNRRRLTPELQSSGSAAAARRLRRHCVVELALGLGVLAVVALLGATAPS